MIPYLTNGEGDELFKAYIDDTKAQLIAGESVLVFEKYQLEALIEIFGKNLEYYYENEYSWWDAKLKDPLKYLKKKKRLRPRRREDITLELILDLKKQGMNNHQIAKKLNCTDHVIRKRLGKEDW